MSTAIRAFLILRIGDAWKITVHRELEDLIAHWKQRPGPDQTSGIVHIGFERPQSRIFDDLIELYAGQVLLTASAKYGLPFGFESTEFPVGTAEGLPVYLATKGWGYLLEPTSIAAPQTTSHVHSRKTYGWVTRFLEEFPRSASEFAEVGIWDEAEYLLREAMLSRQTRLDSGVYRLRLLLEDRNDPCAIAKVAPPWLAERQFSTIDLRVRVENVFNTLGIHTVADLGKCSLADLLSTQNFGRKSVGDLLESLERALLQGPYSDITEPSNRAVLTEQPTLIEAITASLQKLPERAADIVLRRMGLGRTSQTLQELGEDFGITRERVRQIEAKTISKLMREEVWDDILSQKLSLLLKDRSAPLPLKGIDAADAWLAGIGANGEALQYLLENVQITAKLVNIGGIEYLGFLSQAQWDQAVSNARSFLDASADRGLTIEQCKAAVLAELTSQCQEFRELLWEHASRHCHFIEQGGESILLGHGRGADHVVQAVLASSERPLHYSEIARQVTIKAGREFDVRRVHNAAGNVGHLFGLGTYGIDSHIPLSPTEMSELAAHAAEVVEEGPPERQWHANELLAELVERGWADPERTTKYILDIALKKSGLLESFGRLVWAQAGDARSDGVARIDIRQAVLAVLKDAGGPLETYQIRLRVREMRGLDKPFQMHIVDPLIRLGPSLYGLNDRDIALKREEQPAVLDGVASWLDGRQKGIHQSELEDAPILRQLGITGLSLFCLAANDPRMRVSTGRYLYLEEWGEPRRESLIAVVKAVMEAAQRPLTMDDIVIRASEKLGRPSDRVAIVSCLKSIDAQWNSNTGRWALPVDSTDRQLEAHDLFGPG